MIQNPPSPKGRIAIIRDFATNRLAAFQEVATHGDIVRLQLLQRPIYFINHPDYIKHVLVDNNRNYHKGQAIKAAGTIIGNGLLTSEDDFHKRQRRMIQPAFHRRRIETYADVMTEYTHEHSAGWQIGEKYDMHHELMSLTMAIVAKCLFDVDVRGTTSELGMALEGVFDNFAFFDSTPLGVMLGKLPLPRQQRRKHHQKILEDAIYGFIHQRRADADLSDRDDLLSMLMEAVDTEGDGTGMTDQQLFDETMTLFLAGHETTANALSWSLYLLSQHDDVEEKLRDELETVLEGRQPTLADLPNLPYNKMVFSEALRLYPPAWIIGRTALEDDEIGGYHIPAGAAIVMSQYVMHRNPLYWHDPDDFIPERFTTKDETRPRYAYFPFGAGPRLCIGEPFAWVEGELLLATLMQQFHFTLTPDAVIEPDPLVTLRLKNGLPMVVYAGK